MLRRLKKNYFLLFKGNYFISLKIKRLHINFIFINKIHQNIKLYLSKIKIYMFVIKISTLIWPHFYKRRKVVFMKYYIFCKDC